MKEQIKKLICTALACACIAPAGTVGVLADDTASASEGTVINEYTFENGTTSTTTGINGGVMNSTESGIVTGIGTNETSVMKLAKTDTNDPTFWDLTRTKGGDDSEKTWLNVTTDENSYIKVDTKVYYSDDKFASIRLTDNWCGIYNNGKADVTADMLEKGKWNDVSWIISFSNARWDGGVQWYTATVDVVVNGIVVAEGLTHNQSNTILRANQNWNLEKNYNCAYLTVAMTGEMGAVCYIDDVRATAYAEKNFTLGKLINKWTFDTNASNWKADTNGLIDLEGATSSVSNIGGNATNVAKVGGPTAIYMLNYNRPNLNVGSTPVVMYEEGKNLYETITFDLYAEEDNDFSFNLLGFWGSTVLSEQISSSSLKAGKWNNIAIVLKLDNARSTLNDDRYVTKRQYDITTDVWVNGVLVSDGKKIENITNEYYGTKINGKDNLADFTGDIDRFTAKLQFSNEKSFECYIDNVEVINRYGDMKDVAELFRDPTLIKPKLMANSASTVSEDTVTVIEGTKASQLVADTEVDITVTRDDEDVDLDEALKAGDVIEIVRKDNADTYSSYTVAIAESKLVAPQYYVSCSNGWYVYYDRLNYDKIKEHELEAATYAFPAEVYNTTGKTVKVCTIWGLYESDGTLVDVKLAYTDVPSSFTVKSVRLDYAVTQEQLKTGRYLKAMLFDSSNFRSIVHGTK